MRRTKKALILHVNRQWRVVPTAATCLSVYLCIARDSNCGVAFPLPWQLWRLNNGKTTFDEAEGS
jgi:hypothetical protein